MHADSHPSCCLPPGLLFLRRTVQLFLTDDCLFLQCAAASAGGVGQEGLGVVQAAAVRKGSALQLREVHRQRREQRRPGFVCAHSTPAHVAPCTIAPSGAHALPLLLLLFWSFVHRVQEIDLNLHSMGRLFLNVWLRYIFDLCVFLHFLAILISYVLAGSEAWGGVRRSATLFPPPRSSIHD